MFVFLIGPDEPFNFSDYYKTGGPFLALCNSGSSILAVPPLPTKSKKSSFNSELS